MRALAITRPKRSTTMPEIPTTAGLVSPRSLPISYALFAPAGIPTPIVEHEATVAVLTLPDLRDKLREQGAEVVADKPAELAAFVAAEIPNGPRWRVKPASSPKRSSGRIFYGEPVSTSPKML